MAKHSAVQPIDRLFFAGLFLSLLMGSAVSLVVLLSLAF